MQRVLVFKNKKLMFTGTISEVREFIGAPISQERSVYNCAYGEREFCGYDLRIDKNYTIEKSSSNSSVITDRRMLSNDRNSARKLESEIRAQMMNVIDIIEKNDLKRTNSVLANLYLIQELAEDLGKHKLSISQLEEKLSHHSTN